ncbi:MAG TPA: hypothetical protein DIT25_00480 [Candidatus Moranbacteria bacterium]|nr:hypothetical protein [Candidatus Moranbacteria bacterium]
MKAIRVLVILIVLWLCLGIFIEAPNANQSGNSERETHHLGVNGGKDVQKWKTGGGKEESIEESLRKLSEVTEELKKFNESFSADAGHVQPEIVENGKKPTREKSEKNNLDPETNYQKGDSLVKAASSFSPNKDTLLTVAVLGLLCLSTIVMAIIRPKLEPYYIEGVNRIGFKLDQIARSAAAVFQEKKEVLLAGDEKPTEHVERRIEKEKSEKKLKCLQDEPILFFPWPEDMQLEESKRFLRKNRVIGKMKKLAFYVVIIPMLSVLLTMLVLSVGESMKSKKGFGKSINRSASK